MSAYTLISRISGFTPCPILPHAEMSLGHILPDTNWKVEQSAPGTWFCKCKLCGEERIYKEAPEKTLLNSPHATF